MSEPTQDPQQAGREKTPYDRDAKLLDHEYDGIQEYDNPMPRWWKNLFWATIVFSILYIVNVGPIGSGDGRIAQYEAEMAAARARFPQAAQVTGDAELATLEKDPAVLALGKSTFAQNCAACHRADGGGLIGPNLTDEFWLHGGRLSEVMHTVEAGVLAKGMPSWEKVLKPEQVRAVVAYVGTLRGTHPKDGKPPEGVPVTGEGKDPGTE